MFIVTRFFLIHYVKQLKECRHFRENLIKICGNFSLSSAKVECGLKIKLTFETFHLHYTCEWRWVTNTVMIRMWLLGGSTTRNIILVRIFQPFQDNGSKNGFSFRFSVGFLCLEKARDCNYLYENGQVLTLLNSLHNM